MAEGAVGIMPTDTVYGLVASGADAGAVARVYEVKGRPASKPLPLLIAGREDAQLLTFAESPEALRLMDAFWPGPLTLVLKRRPGFALAAQDPDTLGLRMPDCPMCLALIQRSGFVVAPSANRSGGVPPSSFEGVEPEMMRAVDFAVDAGRCPGGTESTVVRLNGEPEVLREGAIPRSVIMAAAG